LYKYLNLINITMLAQITTHVQYMKFKKLYIFAKSLLRIYKLFSENIIKFFKYIKY